MDTQDNATGSATGTAAPAPDFIATCDDFRKRIAIVCGELTNFKNARAQELPPALGTNRGEEMANLMLAFRHLEDASMRIGKTIQAATGGISKLGGPSTPGTSLPTSNGVATGGAIAPTQK